MDEDEIDDQILPSESSVGNRSTSTVMVEDEIDAQVSSGECSPMPYTKAKAKRRGLPCLYCGKILKCCSELLKHISMYHMVNTSKSNLGFIRMKNPFVCFYCGLLFQQTGPFMDHVNSVHSSELDTPLSGHGCNKCGQIFYYGGALGRHRANHNRINVPQFSCIFCGVGYHSDIHLDKHVATYHDAAYFEIEVNVTENMSDTVSKTSAEANIIWHSGDIQGIDATENGPCPDAVLCQYKNSEKTIASVDNNIGLYMNEDTRDKDLYNDSSAELNCHTEFAEMDGSETNSLDTICCTEEKVKRPGLPCLYCGKILKHCGELLEHISAYHLVNAPQSAFRSRLPFKCFYCGRKFQKTAPFMDHVNSVHSKRLDTPLTGHGCNKCGQIFYYSGALGRHRANHNRINVPQFSCIFCGVGYHSDIHLDQHIATYHDAAYLETEVNVTKYIPNTFSKTSAVEGKALHNADVFGTDTTAMESNPYELLYSQYRNYMDPVDHNIVLHTDKEALVEDEAQTYQQTVFTGNCENLEDSSTLVDTEIQKLSTPGVEACLHQCRHYNNEMENNESDPLISCKQCSTESCKIKRRGLPCLYCGKIVNTCDELLKHNSMLHPLNPPESCFSSAYKGDPFVCFYCGLKFQKTAPFMDHVNSVHSSELDTSLSGYGCNKCGQIFYYRRALNRHRAVHNRFSVAQFSCLFCGLCFQFERHLIKHIASVHGTAYMEVEANVTKDTLDNTNAVESITGHTEEITGIDSTATELCANALLHSQHRNVRETVPPVDNLIGLCIKEEPIVEDSCNQNGAQQNVHTDISKESCKVE